MRGLPFISSTLTLAVREDERVVRDNGSSIKEVLLRPLLDSILDDFDRFIIGIFKF